MRAAIESMGYSKSPYEPDTGMVAFQREDVFDVVMIDLDHPTDIDDFGRQCDRMGVDFQTFSDAVDDI